MSGNLNDLKREAIKTHCPRATLSLSLMFPIVQLFSAYVLFSISQGMIFGPKRNGKQYL